MVRKYGPVWILVFVFGLPFLVITDLFPFHRFGMFARIPSQPGEVVKYQFQQKTKGKNWEAVKVGNAYFDQNYLPMLAEKLVLFPEKAEVWGDKLYRSLSSKPDSIKIISSSNSENQVILVYPR
jgi:hypothetical protein